MIDITVETLGIILVVIVAVIVGSGIIAMMCELHRIEKKNKSTKEERRINE